VKHFLLGALLLLALPVQAEKPTAPQQIEGVTRVDAETTIQLILDKPNLVVIDSRKGEEYAKGHIEDAVNILNTRMTRQELARYVPSYDTPVLFYCNGARCLRSSNAVSKAKEWGYRHLYWFRGGWVEWLNKKLPVAR